MGVRNIYHQGEEEEKPVNTDAKGKPEKGKPEKGKLEKGKLEKGKPENTRKQPDTGEKEEHQKNNSVEVRCSVERQFRLATRYNHDSRILTIL